MINLRKHNQAMITINGQTFYGDNVSIRNGKITVDGKDHTPADSKTISISVQGDLKDLSVDSCSKVDIKGNVTNAKTISGDIDISGDVAGSVSAVSGDIKCGNINGSVSTVSGDIKNKK